MTLGTRQEIDIESLLTEDHVLQPQFDKSINNHNEWGREFINEPLLSVLPWGKNLQSVEKAVCFNHTVVN